jgi:hypothetical protein
MFWTEGRVPESSENGGDLIRHYYHEAKTQTRRQKLPNVAIEKVWP